MQVILTTLCSSLFFFCSLSAMDNKPIDKPKDKKRKVKSLESNDKKITPNSHLQPQQERRQTRSQSVESKPSTLEPTIQPIKSPQPTQTKRSLFSLQLPIWHDENDSRSPRDEKRSDQKKRATSSSPSKSKRLEPDKKLASSDSSIPNLKLSPKTSPKRNFITSSAPASPVSNAALPVDFSNARAAIFTRQIDPLRSYLADKNNDPNKAGDNGHTLLHFVILQITSLKPSHRKYSKILEMRDLLLENPKVCSLIANNNGLTPVQYIENTDIKTHQSSYDSLKQRELIDHIIYALLVTKLVAKKYNNDAIKEKVTKIYQKIPHDKIPHYVTIGFMCNMIDSFLHSDIDRQTIQIMHDQYQSDPNRKDERGNTFLHQAAYLRNQKLINKLLSRPDIICDTPNKTGFMPAALLSSLQDEPLRSLFFIRSSVNNWVNDGIAKAPLKYPTIKDFNISKTTDAQFTLIKNSIIDEAQGMDSDQKGSQSSDHDRALPQKSTCLPAYATDDFLLAMILNSTKSIKAISTTEALECLETFNPNPSSSETPSETDTSEIEAKDPLPIETVTIDRDVKK